jgi:hypothetical protein
MKFEEVSDQVKPVARLMQPLFQRGNVHTRRRPRSPPAPLYGPPARHVGHCAIGRRRSEAHDDARDGER